MRGLIQGINGATWRTILCSPITAESVATRLNGYFWDHTQNVALTGSDVNAWESVVGESVLYEPSHWGNSNGPPQWSATGFAAGRGGLVFSANDALIADKGWTVFSGVNSLLSWSWIVHVISSSAGYFLTCGNTASSTQYCGHRLAPSIVHKDDAGADGSVTGTAVGEDVEHVIAFVKQGTSGQWYIDGVADAAGPFVIPTNGQSTFDRGIVVGGLLRRVDTWSTSWWGDGNSVLGELLVAPGAMTVAEIVAITQEWLP